MANNDKENKIKKFTKEAIGKTLNQFNKEIGIADLVEVNKNQDRILNGILSQVNDENTEKTEKSNIITLDNSTDGIVELKEIQGDTNVNVSKIAEETPITHVIEDKEGNAISLDDITEGVISIDNIQGNTMVNCNKESDKELILMEDLSTQGYSNVTLTEGVNGGLVDVSLEGNTMVNVCDQKDPVAITKSYTVETGNHVALQGEYDGKCRPVVTGNTLWIDNDTEDVLTAFDATKNLRLQSSFEDKVVTQEMVDAGEEEAENLGKYKVDYVISQEDGTIGQTKTFYLNSPLLEGDTIEQQGDNVVHVHRYKEIVLDGSADEVWSKDANVPVYKYILLDAYKDSTIGYGEAMCDKYAQLKGIIGSMDGVFKIQNFSNNLDISVQFARQSISTVNDWKTYLQQNPTTVVYQLKSPQYEVISQNDTILCDSYVNGHLDVDSAVPIEKVVFAETPRMTLKYLYPSTNYIVQFESDNAGSASIVVGDKNIGTQTVVKGINKFNATTNETPNTQLKIGGIGFNASNIVVTEATDQEFGYFEGMKSVGECEDLEVVSCNSDGTLSNTQALTHEPLRAVGDIKDKYVLIDGKWYIERNLYETKISRDNGFTINLPDINNDNVYIQQSKEYLKIPAFYYSDSYLCSNKYISRPNEYLHGQYQDVIGITADGFIRLLVSVSKITNIIYDSYDKAEEVISKINEWLNNQDIKIVYRLLTPTYEPIDYNPLEVYLGTTHISNNSTIPCNMTIKNTGYNCLLKPNTTYTVSSNLGLNTVTTPSTLTEDCLRFYDTDTSDITKMNNVTILEGDYTTGKPIPSHFSGIESAFEQEYDEEKGKYKVKTRVQNEDASKENYIEFYINEPLRGVGEVKDKIYVKDDKVVVQRNCVSATFDGSNDEKWYKVADGEYPEYLGVINTGYSFGKCNNFKYAHNGNYERFAIDGINLCIKIRNVKLQTQDITGFKQWLQQNPTTIVYQLASPTYEEVDYQEQRLFLNTYNNSTLFYESNIPVSNTSFKPLWEELVYLKNSTKYYIQFNSTASGTVVFNLGGTEVTKDIVEGYNNIAITTPAETTNLLTIDGHGIKISEVVVSESVCSGHYLGLQSCFEEHMENGKYRVLLRGIALDGSKVNGIKLYINEPLRGIEDIKDRLCVKDGKLMVERNIAERIVDDTTPINMSITNDEFTRFTVYHEGVRYPDHKLIKCSGFPTQGDKLNAETILLNTDNIVFAIANARLKSIDVEGFKEWIKEHPQKVQFKVSTTYEEVTNEYGLPIVFEGYENGIVYIDSAVTPITHIKYTSNNQLATTLSEAEEQNIATQEDINMNVITYMMDIDMMLTDMEMSNDISVMAVRRDNSNENMLDRMSDEDKKVYRDNTVVMLEKMITANVLEKEDIEGRIDMYYNKNRISKEQYKYLKSLL